MSQKCEDSHAASTVAAALVAALATAARGSTTLAAATLAAAAPAANATLAARARLEAEADEGIAGDLCVILLDADATQFAVIRVANAGGETRGIAGSIMRHRTCSDTAAADRTTACGPAIVVHVCRRCHCRANAVGLRRQLLDAGYPKLAKRVVQQNVRRRRWAHAASAESLRLAVVSALRECAGKQRDVCAGEPAAAEVSAQLSYLAVAPSSGQEEEVRAPPAARRPRTHAPREA